MPREVDARPTRVTLLLALNAFGGWETVHFAVRAAAARQEATSVPEEGDAEEDACHGLHTPWPASDAVGGSDLVATCHSLAAQLVRAMKATRGGEGEGEVELSGDVAGWTPSVGGTQAGPASPLGVNGGDVALRVEQLGLENK